MVCLVILRNLIAIFMVLAIANPVCCCAVISQSNSQTASQKSRSCCSTQTLGDHSNEREKDCPCSFAKEKVAPEKMAALLASSSDFLPPVLASGECRTPLPKLSQATAFLKKWPPGSLPTPSSSARLAAKCSYLI